MKLNTKTRYGLRAIIEIAINTNNTGVLQKDIATSQGISNKYLDQIIAALKSAKLIKVASGRKSGYVLTRDPKLITMLDIHNAFEPGMLAIECFKPNCSCDKVEYCRAREFWVKVDNRMKETFRSQTLADMLE